MVGGLGQLLKQLDFAAAAAAVGGGATVQTAAASSLGLEWELRWSCSCCEKTDFISHE